MARTTEKLPASELVLPPERLEELLDFSKFLESSGSQAILLGPDGERIGLPSEVYELLKDVLRLMSQGKAITLTPFDQKLTTQQSADFLGMSRPTLIKLLERNEIPFEKLSGSRHRRIRIVDLYAYRAKQRVKQRQLLGDLVRDAEDHGLYENELS